MELYKERISRVCRELEAAGLSQLLVSDYISIYYLTGIEVNPYERFWALLIRTDGSHILFANQMFSLGETGFKTVMFTDTDDAPTEAAKYLGAGLLGVDKNLPARFLLPILDARSDVRPVLGSDCVDRVRACKDETEREIMRRASALNDAVMKKLAAFLHDGVTEKECADHMIKCCMELGGDAPAFDPVISFGANAADPHHMPDDTVIAEGDCVVIDIGCKLNGYCSDMTRTYFWKKASPKHLAIHSLVREANELAEKCLKSGTPLCQLDNTAREHIAQGGYGKYFLHRLGHFIGMTEHEKGDVSGTNTDPAKEGMIFSIEPGVYLDKEFGVRIEDLVLVTKDGCEILNHVDKRAIILGN